MNLKEAYQKIGDYDSAIMRLAGNERILAKYLKKFPADKNYANLVQAYRRNDDTLAYRSAVMLCEVCNSLALTKLSQTSGEIAEAYTTGEAAARYDFNVPLLMITLEAQYQSVLAAIDRLE